MLRLCATQIRYFATLWLKMGCCGFARQKKFYATLCEPKKICRGFARPKLCMLGLCATQIGYVAILRDPNLVFCESCDSKCVCCNFARQKKFYATLSDPKKICCDFVRSKYMRDPKQIWCDFPARGLRFLICCEFVRSKYMRDPN